MRLVVSLKKNGHFNMIAPVLCGYFFFSFVCQWMYNVTYHGQLYSVVHNKRDNIHMIMICNPS